MIALRVSSPDEPQTEVGRRFSRTAGRLEQARQILADLEPALSD
jgi:hypothetical protein